jgi:hypothetical protein
MMLGLHPSPPLPARDSNTGGCKPLAAAKPRIIGDDQRRPALAATSLARPARKTHPQHRTPLTDVDLAA